MRSIKALTCFCRILLHNSFSKTLFPNHNSYYNSPSLSSREKKLFILIPIFSREDCFTSERVFFFENEPLIAAWPAFNKSKQIKEGLGSFHPLNLEQYFEIMGWTSFRVNARESKTVLDSGFHVIDSGFQLLDSGSFVSGTGNPDPNR